MRRLGWTGSDEPAWDYDAKELGLREKKMKRKAVLTKDNRLNLAWAFAGGYDAKRAVLEIAVETEDFSGLSRQERLDLWWYDKNTGCICNAENDYWVRYDRIMEQRDIIEWVCHLVEKGWVTRAGIRNFLIMCDRVRRMRLEEEKHEET